MEKIKVLIADVHRVVREGLAAILKTKEDINVVGEAQDGMEAVEKTKALMPDVILMDVSMPRMGESRPHVRSSESFRISGSSPLPCMRSSNTSLILCVRVPPVIC